MLTTLSLISVTGCSEKSNDTIMPDDGFGRVEALSSESQEETTPTTDAELRAPLPKNGITICVDPGHGFVDTGTESEFLGELYEKDINFAVALKLKEHLIHLGFDVIMTHNGVEVPITNAYYNHIEHHIYRTDERASFANERIDEIDYYISLHCNAFSTPDAYGTVLYYYEGPTKASKVDAQICEVLKKSIIEHFPDSKIPSVKNDIFYVIKYTQMPATLIEMGFATNEGDAKNLIDPQWQDEFAKALAEGLHNYYFPTVTPENDNTTGA